MSKTVLKGGEIVNRGKRFAADVLIENSQIALVAPVITAKEATEVDCTGKLLIPGIIDDQVHFRTPGSTHKADIFTESRAAVAGGITTFMDMPNTVPNTLTQELLEDKYQMGAEMAHCNYSFFMGASNDNIEEALKTDKTKVCGLKIFMGSSTGNMLVDNEKTLENLFSKIDFLIATHCEDEATIRSRKAAHIEKYGDKLDASFHPIIRNVEGCYISSSFAANLAKKYNTRLHILHITSAKETHLFDNNLPLRNKRLTSEACVHHMTFNDSDYEQLGNDIICNPAIKQESDRQEIIKAVLDDRIDIIATDHAPHTREEKDQHYLNAPSGLPLIQHSFNMVKALVDDGYMGIEKLVEKMCHAPAECFSVQQRGYLEEGMFADIAVIDEDREWTVSKENILYKCGWSPLEGRSFKSRVVQTFVNGQMVFDLDSNGLEVVRGAGERVLFNRF